MITELRLTQDFFNELIRYADSKLPKECGVMLLGKIEGDAAIVEDLFFTDNPENTPAMFTVLPETLIEAYQAADSLGMELVGIYHSHPFYPAVPSSTDHAYMQTNDVAWIIYSNTLNVARTWKLKDSIPVEITTSVKQQV